MDTLERVRRLGFRRWYERELIESHAYFVTCFGCLILVAVVLEMSGLAEMATERPLLLLLILGAGVLGVFSWKRFRVILARAERFAERAVCAQCGAYGALDVLDHGAPSAGPEDAGWMQVRCRKCAHRWTIE